MNVGDRKQRSPAGTEVIRRRALRCQSSRKARVALGASLALMFGATATLGGEVEDVAFVGTPTGGYYNAGEAIGLEVAFTEPVTVTGAPTFTLTVGRLQRNMVYDAQASSADTLRFNYTVVDGDMDDDGVSYGANALRGGRIESGSPPSAVDRTHPARARDSNRRVDARKPRVAAVRLTSNPGPDRVYGIGDTVEVTATFDELVTTGDAVLALTVGRESRDMVLAGTGRRRALIFRYTVIEGDEDANGVSVAADALSGTIQDAAGNEATLALRRVPDQSGHAVDGIPPSDPSLRIVSNPRGGGIYRRGESILVELRFGETVQVSGDANPTLTLRVGTRDDDVTRSATYDPDRSGGRALVFRYVVVEADSDQDGISVAADAVTPADVIRDSAGSLWDGTHSALAEQRSHRVDGSLPTVRVKDVDITSVGPYGVDDSIALEVRFTGPVHGADNNMKFRLRVGDETEEMDYDDGNGSETLTFEYEVQQGDLDDDGVGYAANALVGSGRLIDGHGWPVDRAVAARTRLSDQVVDGVHPRVIGVKERAGPRDGDTYGRGESIRIAVMFSERVIVSHDPDLKLELRIGDAVDTRQGILASGDGTETLVFRYTVQDGDQGDSVAVAGLLGGEVGDLAGNRVAAVAGNVDIKVDGVAPGLQTVSIVSDPGEDNTYAAGDRIEMEVVFDDVVKVSGRPVLLISFDSPSHDPLTRRATLERTRPTVLAFAYTVQPGDIDTDGISIAGSGALYGGRITDAASNPVARSFEPLDDDDEHRVDAVEPSVAGIDITSDPGPDGTYAVGDAIIVTVTFDEVMHATSPLGLDIAVGAESRRAGYVDGSGTTTLRFRYEVQVGDRDDDGISIGPNAIMPEDAIMDVAGNPPVGIPAMRRHSAHKVAADGVPTVSSVRILAPPGGSGFRAGDRIDVHVIFDRVVHVTGAPVLTLSIGANNRAAAFAGGSGTDTLRFHYTVVAADRDADGISIPANALSEGRITDDTDNRADTRFRAVPPDMRWTVDGSVRGTFNASLAITSVPEAGTTYGLGEDIDIEVRFNTLVHATDDPVLVLEIGGGTAVASLISGSGTDTLTFRYRVQEGDFDDDGISVGPNALQEGRIENGAGNVVQRTFAALAADGDHKVDSVSPTVVRVTVVSNPDTGDTYGVDEAIRVEVYFGNEVHVTEDGGALSLVLSVGENLRSATLSGGSGTDTLTFSYVIRENDSDDDGISIGPNALQGGVIEDAAGNTVNRAFAGLAADGDHKVDGVRPVLTRVAIMSAPGESGFYGLDDEIEVEVAFGEVVHVDAAEDVTLAISVGEHSRAATFVRGSGTDTLTFRYVVTEDDYDDDGVSIGPSALRGGMIEDAAGNTVNRAFAGLAADGDHKVDGVRPVLTRVAIMSAPGESGFYGLDDEIEVEVAFGEVVHVDAAEDVTLAISVGEHSRAATFVRGSGTDTLTFRYVVTEDDYDDDGVSIGPSALRGGTIEDAAGNAVERAFPGLEADSGQTVDGRVNRVVPAILRVAITSDAGSNNSYTTDDVIGVEVEFNVAVYVTGATPVLELSIGPALREAIFVEGSGSRTLRFEYTVEAGDTDTDGISIAANSLSGGITDANGNLIDISFEAIPASASHKVSAELLLFPLSLTLVVGQSHSLDLLRELERLGVRYVGGFEWSSDDEAVATATLAGSMLTITSVSEGVARITVAATDAAIFLHFGVTVETSAAETAVLEGAMAAVGRGLLASAESTIGARLEMAESNPPDIWGGLGMAPASASAAAGPHWLGLDAADRWGSPVGHGHPGVDDPYLQRSIGYAPAQLLRGRWFDMPFGGLGNSVDSWAVWGAGDWHAFEGSPEDGIYDGSLASAYLGVDARGQGWVAGATVSRSLAEASYEFAGTAGGKGRLETELDAIHPYVQWAFGDRGKMWAILGFGTGEATAEREGDAVAAEPSSLSMLMGLGGLRYSFGRVVGVDLAVRGDAGFAQLETEEGPRAIEGLAVNVHRLRLGAEASLPMAFAGIPVSPFLDVAGRFDGGAGLTGGGVELAGGFRYRGPAVGLEVKGRTLAMHSAESYTEEGVKATLVIGPDGRRGFRLMLAPRWGGGAEAMDIFRYRGQPFAGALRRENRGWGLGTRISYGFDMLRRPGTVMPFAEMDLSGDASRRARLGVSYEIASAVLGLPHRLEISGEGTESELHGTILRFLLTGQAHF